MPARERAPEPEAETDGARRSTPPVLIVAGTVLAAVLLALVIYKVAGRGSTTDVNANGRTADTAGPSSTGACGVGTPDPSYTVAVTSDPDPPRAEGTTFHLTVRHNGQAVTGAKVCLTADMPDMQHSGVNTAAAEGPGGRYDAELKFAMGGTWRMAVTVAEPGKPVVTVPLVLQVAMPPAR